MKWDKYYNLPEIEEIRKKIKETYSDKLVFIEETHQYFLDGVEMECVSNITHRFKAVNSEQMAENCVKKWQRDQDPSYEYYGMSKEEILAKWAVKSGKACEFGTNVHAFGESMFYYMTEQHDKILPECADRFKDGVPHPSNMHEEAVVKFWNDIPENMVPVLAETKVFNRNGTSYSGTFDILFYYVCEEDSSKSGLVIMDYKTNEDLYKNFRRQTLLWPFNDLLDMNESFYKLQLSCYQIPLENLGFKIVGRRILWLLPTGEYKKIKIESLTDRLRDALDIPTAEEIISKNII